MSDRLAPIFFITIEVGLIVLADFRYVYQLILIMMMIMANG